MRHQQGALKAVQYHFRRTTLAMILLGTYLTTGCTDSQAPGFTDSLGENPSPVQVIETNPPEDAQDVELTTYVQAIFNTTIDPANITDSTFVIRQSGTIIEGSISPRDSSLTFFPTNVFQRDETIIATLSSQIADTQGNTMDQDFEWSFTTREATTQEIIPPAVTSTDPSPGTTEVSAEISIYARFNKALTPSTVNNNTFLLRAKGNSISGSVSYEDSTAIFNPSETLKDGTVYTATITDGIRDVYGNTPGNNYDWNFITKDVDRTPPHVASTQPREDEDDILFDIDITATFSERVDPATVNNNTFRLRTNNGTISGSVSYEQEDSTAIFNPSENLQDGIVYTATITDGIRDLNGNSPNNNYNWNFTTKEIDRTPPRIVSTNPRDDDDNVSVDIQITVTFSEPMDASTISEDTFGLYQWRAGQYRKISGSVNYSDNKATLTPRSELRDERHYVTIISSDVTDLAGNELGDVYRWSFETEDD